MKFNILTIFPHIFDSYINESIIGKAIANNKIRVNVINIRDFATDKHKKVDDEPYGGGQGMLMKVEPIVNALNSLDDPGKIILLTPQGRVLNQKEAKKFAKSNQTLTFICGRYEGFDYRIMDYIDEEWSIGDFVLTGGELPAMVLLDSITRLVPGIIKHGSHSDDSFEENLLEYPQYTRPEIFEGKKVPKVLTSGNHKAIREWKKKNALRITREKRPDLLDK